MAPRALLLWGCLCAVGQGADGDDVVRALGEAAGRGRVVVAALGGSITQAGDGWIGPWLRARLPGCTVEVVNAGMSATGSWPALFRTGRDVEASRPDLVLVEFTVNDGWADVPAVRWQLESLLHRLEGGPAPPGIVMVEAADRQRPSGAVPVHRLVAQRHHRLAIDLQAVADAATAPARSRWDALFSDDVHPNAAGHAVYATALATLLDPLLRRAQAGERPSLPPPPGPPGGRPLLGDGALLVPPADDVGWRRLAQLPEWWDRFFHGATVSAGSGHVLEIPFRGTAVGVLMACDPASGVLAWSVDGSRPRFLRGDFSHGYAAVPLLEDLPPGDHVLRLVVPERGEGEAGVALGQILCGGPALAATPPAPQDGLAGLRWDGPLVGDWAVTGPYGDLGRAWPEGPTAALTEVLVPELALPGREAVVPGMWRACTGRRLALDFTRFGGHPDRGVAYAWTAFDSAIPQVVRAELSLDYWGAMWLDGHEVLQVARRSGPPAAPFSCELKLTQGRHDLVVKVHAGSRGHLVSLRLEAERAVRWSNPVAAGIGH